MKQYYCFILFSIITVFLLSEPALSPKSQIQPLITELAKEYVKLEIAGDTEQMEGLMSFTENYFLDKEAKQFFTEIERLKAA